MAKVAITAKRQATLPATLCDDLGVGPGDVLDVERRVLKGRPSGSCAQEPRLVVDRGSTAVRQGAVSQAERREAEHSAGLVAWRSALIPRSSFACSSASRGAKLALRGAAWNAPSSTANP